MRTRKLQYTLISIFILAATSLFGCSSGTGGGESSGSPPLAVVTAASGHLKLGTVGTPNLIAGIDMTVNLPAGVSVNADPATGEAASGTVTISGGAAAGGNSLVVAKYTPASNGTPAHVHIVVVNVGGFPVGEFLTIGFDVATGASLPATGAFTVANFSAKGIDGSTLGGISAEPLSVEAVGNAAAKNKAQQVVTGDQNFLNVSIDTPTRNSSQTITGTLFPGDGLVISTNTTATVSAPTITGGAWSARVSGLREGDNIITVTETDPLGNIVASVSATIILDTKAPDLTVNAIFGTKDSFKGIDGTVDDPPYHIVTVEVNCDYATPDFAVVAVPFWSAMIHDLLYGDNRCTVTATDLAGNHVSKDVHIYYDDIAPLLDIHVNALAKYNWVQTVSGTVESGVTPTVTVNTLATVSEVTTTATGTGTAWSAQLSGLPEGDNVITVSASDQYGNITTKTATISVYVCNGSFTGAAHPAVGDALKALRIAVGLDIPAPEDLIRGDLFDDGLNKIDVADVILILKNAIDLFGNDLSFDNLYPYILH